MLVQLQTSKSRKFKRNYANCEKILFLSQLPTTVSSNIRLDGSKYIFESLDFDLSRPTFRMSEALVAMATMTNFRIYQNKTLVPCVKETFAERKITPTEGIGTGGQDNLMLGRAYVKVV